MISSDPRSSPGLARLVESYEAKCERHQETRESRCCRRNETTCHQPGKVLRTQHREQLQRARQLQFLRRRNLEEETKGQAKEQGPSSKTNGGTGQVAILKKSLPGANRTFSPRKQVTETSCEVFPTLCHSSSSIRRDSDGHHPSHRAPFPAQDSAIGKPHRQHQGTQTKAEETQPTMKNDASQQTNCGVAVLDKDIIQLSEYLKEALQRELILKQKMVILQNLLPALTQASDNSWKGQINEDKLKGKLRSLENQLYACMQKHSPWGMKKVLLEMEEQKSSYEQKAKESLQKLLEEKMGAEQRLHSVQLSLALAEQKCKEWKTQYEALKEDWRTLGEHHRELESQLHVLQSKLQGADSRDSQMSQALRLLENEHQELQAKIELLQGDREQQSSDTQGLKDQLKKSEEEKQALVSRVQQLQNLLQNQSLQLQEQEKLLKKDQALPVWNPKLSLDEVKPGGTGKEKDGELRDQLQKEMSQLQTKEKECRELHSELDTLNEKYLSCLRKLQNYQEALSHSQEPFPRQLSPVSTSFHTAAKRPLAPSADGGACYSTGSVPGEQRQPGDLNNFWHLSGVEDRSKQLHEKLEFQYFTTKVFSPSELGLLVLYSHHAVNKLSLTRPFFRAVYSWEINHKCDT